MVKVLVNNDYCVVKISYKLFKKVQRKFSKGVKYFSQYCEKYDWSYYYETIES